jgi:hypothetical protein
MRVSHSALIIQMFQIPALIVLTISATRMHRSLTNFSHSGYYTYCFLRSVLMLSTTDVSVSSVPIRLGEGIWRRQIQN